MYCAYAPVVTPHTASPTLNLEHNAPTLTTVPAKSAPRILNKCRTMGLPPGPPSTMSTSDGLTEDTLTLTSTSPSPGFGTSMVSVTTQLKSGFPHRSHRRRQHG